MDTPIIINDGSLTLEMTMPRIDQLRKISDHQLGHPSPGRILKIETKVGDVVKARIFAIPGVPTEIAIDYTGEKRILVISSDAFGRGVSIVGSEAFFGQITTGATQLPLKQDAGKITGVTIDDKPVPNFPPSEAYASVIVWYRPDSVVELKIVKAIAVGLIGIAGLACLWNILGRSER